MQLGSRRPPWQRVRAEKRLSLWNKGGGRVLPGLTRRRREEFHLIRYGAYSLPFRRASRRS